MHILLATPTYGGVGTDHIATMMRLQAWLLGQGVQVSVLHQAMAEVARSRNIIATHFVEREELTHLLFVDSDMTFQPSAVEALVRADKPLVGCVYPKRSIDFERLVAAARRHDDLPTILASAMDYVVVPGAEPPDVDAGITRVDGIGMGLALIRREVFDGLLATGSVKQDATGAAVARTRLPVLGFFDPLITDTGFLAEDLSFCRRWREWCDGEVWAVLDQEIGHVGSMVYSGRVIDALRGGGSR